VARLVAGVLRAEGARRAAVSVAFVGSRRIRSLSRSYLGHDGTTDVIALTMSPPSGRRVPSVPAVPPVPAVPSVIGDVYVCVPVARAQARRYRTSLAAELRRLVVHGVLHVLGYDHAGGEGRTTGAMWRRQERYLRRLGSLVR
jgi:probable rRNA maturation factor